MARAVGAEVRRDVGRREFPRQRPPVGDQPLGAPGQALGALQAVMNSANEQPSIRDAATQAYTAIRGR